MKFSGQLMHRFHAPYSAVVVMGAPLSQCPELAAFFKGYGFTFLVTRAEKSAGITAVLSSNQAQDLVQVLEKYRVDQGCVVCGWIKKRHPIDSVTHGLTLGPRFQVDIPLSG